MTILIKGVLNIKASGIAMLQCDVGHFLVEHPSLKSLSVGKHAGFFEILKIQPHVTSNSKVTQLVLHATLKDFSLQASSAVVCVDIANARPCYKQASFFMDTDITSDSNEVVSDVQPDVATDSASVADVSPTLTTGVVSKAAVDEVEMIEETVTPSQDAPLLSDTLLPTLSTPLPEEVELDSTLPREQLREKIQQLKAAGYRFNSNQQLWQRAA